MGKKLVEVVKCLPVELVGAPKPVDGAECVPPNTEDDDDVGPPNIELEDDCVGGPPNTLPPFIEEPPNADDVGAVLLLLSLLRKE